MRPGATIDRAVGECSNLSPAPRGVHGTDAPVRQSTLAVRRAYDAYRTLLAKQIGLSETEAATASAATFAFETELAQASMTRVARRDPNAIYHLHTVASLSTLAPGLDWGEFVAALGVTQPAEINVLNPAFVQAIAQ